ncbi:hypothetical protein [Burkholderia ubonensis]|uniref:hypothetical protein n=1 Tax=Burkholderia ubonensis TaxID=101571 RepID=UPI0007597FF7|nr:hypothetical protein [Burkholderia ubonensis]KVV07397.1 hypothetical protein WK77_16550 [Burkholderia ubonensis]
MDLSIVLEARVQWALATYACDPEATGDYTEYGAKMERAEELAYRAAWTDPHAPVPHLFADVPFLRDIFVQAAADSLNLIAEIEAEAEEERRQIESKAERLRERERINALVAANEWAALDLPTPEELTATLSEGGSATVNGHFVDYDSEDGLTWYTNPYGIDGVLFDGQPTIDGVKVFLTDMARGIEYGPSPD